MRTHSLPQGHSAWCRATKRGECFSDNNVVFPVLFSFPFIIFRFVQCKFATLRVYRHHLHGDYSCDGCQGRNHHPVMPPSEMLADVSRACSQSNVVAEGKHVHYPCPVEGEGAVLSSRAVGPILHGAGRLPFLGHQVASSDLGLSITPFLTRVANEVLTATESQRVKTVPLFRPEWAAKI